ncbi:uncharacterized protein BXIN_0433 [Babesia sp. Xinjiang]|uniref:uncharacterized protein n=1 Tax=Babesia sp. Xinjiang TaxID=462227 RepID=UPI000A23F883|nr:uncharacterized protein BXIN_0433 [Babesia sp. Xinjiang]ORM41038.1 hypothetical protein BXIN_0433 [Babesia sp. Xinjiang]
MAAGKVQYAYLHAGRGSMRSTMKTPSEAGEFTDNNLALLRKVAKRLKSALLRNKDLKKEKYQRYYQKCKTLTEDLGKQAIEALDSGQTSAFEDIANAVHEASAIITECDELLGVNEVSVGAKTPAYSRNGSRQLDEWVAFPEEGEHMTTAHFGYENHDNRTQGKRKSYIDNDEYTKPTRQDSNIPSAMVILPKNATYSKSHSSEAPNYDQNDDNESKHGSKHGTGSVCSAGRARSIVAEGSRKDKNVQKQRNRRTYDEQSDVVDIGYETNIDDAFHQVKPSWSEDRAWRDSMEGVHVRHNDIGHNAPRSELRHRRHTPTGDDVTHNATRSQAFDRRESRQELNDNDYMPSNSRVEASQVGSHYGDVDVAEETRKNQVKDYETYSALLERCLTKMDCRQLASKLKHLHLHEKITLCEWFVKRSDVEEVDPIWETNKKEREGKRNTIQRLTTTSESAPGDDTQAPEPLWRVKEDGGVSAYLGNYLAKGDPLFIGIHFTAYLSIRTLPRSTAVDAHVEVQRNLQNLDIFIGLLGSDAEAVQVLNRTSTTLTFRCKPDTWSNSMPSLIVNLIESDGTKREILLKMPIGPFSLLRPADIPQKELERIMENEGKIGFYTIHKSFVPKNKLQMYDLLAVLSRYFAVKKTNTKQTLSALDANRDVLVASLRTSGNMFILDMWSPNEKTLASAALYIKEIAGALSSEVDPKASNRALRTISSFPLEFAQRK